jgi:multidrug efflux pump subunit AcrA (membrane-fusion protein)
MMPWMTNRRIQIIVAAGLAGLLALGAWLWRSNNLEYVAPRHGPIIDAIYGLGKVKTQRFYEVKLGVTFTIERLYVREGDRVVRGQPLIKFEGAAVFRAPFAGTVTLVAFQEAQSVFPQQTALRLDDLTTKYIEVSLEQQGALRVRTGQPVKVVFEGIRGEVLQGQVATVFSRNDEFLAHIKVPLADNILPGMTADVSIEAGKRDNALLVPAAAITNGRVTVLRDGKRETVKLKIGGIDGQWAEVLEGDLRDSDRVIMKAAKKKEG